MSRNTKILELLRFWQELRELGKEMTPEELCADCPEMVDELKRRLDHRLPRGSALTQAPSEEDDGTLPPSLTEPPVTVVDEPNARISDFPGYEILGELGRGGMGVVYKARHLRLKRLVAIKMILAGVHAGEADKRRFLLEAEAVARLKHPNIVQIYEIGEAGGHPYFSLEYCEGGSLAQKLSGTPLQPQDAAALVRTLAGAMHAAHQAGIVHRDLKPANVLLSFSRSPPARG